jgi:hypothetical protein
VSFQRFAGALGSGVSPGQEVVWLKELSPLEAVSVLAHVAEDNVDLSAICVLSQTFWFYSMNGPHNVRYITESAT